ncbi:MAG: ribonuclease HI family protein [Leptonema sp. (in: Bacteria)]|nr:ribonuclease HI family protein [Leptonema sp. (in: bacteria)]
MTHFYLYCDGASRGNPGPAAGAAVLYLNSHDSTPIGRFGRSIGIATNNVAEYHGLIFGLEGLLDYIKTKNVATDTVSVDLRMDSQLIIRQLTGEYKVKHVAMLPLYKRAKSLISQFKQVNPQHVRREFNQAADKLANQFLDKS